MYDDIPSLDIAALSREFRTPLLQLIRCVRRLEVLGVVNHSNSAEEAEPLAFGEESCSLLQHTEKGINKKMNINLNQSVIQLDKDQTHQTQADIKLF